MTSACINQQLKASGVAQVIVLIKPDDATSQAPVSQEQAAERAIGTPQSKSSAMAAIESHFSNSDLSQNFAIAAAGLSDPRAFGAAGARRAMRGVPAASPPPPVHYYPNLGVMLGTVDRAGLAALRSEERVAGVIGAPMLRPIWPKRVAAATLASSITWGIEFLGVPQLWKEGLSGKGVRVAHLDTGVDGKHPSLKKAILSFAEFDSFGQLVKPEPKPFDTEDHGTHTAATIAGRPIDGKHVGVAHGADLVSAIVIEGGNVIARVLGGMDWAIGQGVQVLSMSLGFPGYWEEFLPITQILRIRNVLPVIACGNDGPGLTRSPGNYSEALSVGAIDKSGAVAPFSSSQRFKRKKDPIVPDLVAPGVDIISAARGGGYQTMDGTSMATPHIAGLAALLFEAKPTATIDAVEKAIFQSCKRSPSILSDRGNRGVPNATLALKFLTGVQLSASAKGRKVAVKSKKR
jgi:subtilisin family serine protease